MCLDNFIVKDNIQVDGSNTYGYHEKLNFAEIACEKDSQCIGIFDESCDKNGPFSLLKNGFMTPISTSNCLYKKKHYEGASYE